MAEADCCLKKITIFPVAAKDACTDNFIKT
jgi:hypothetical protein